MSQSVRLRDIVAVLQNSHQPVPRERFLAELEVSPATFKRDLAYLRDQLQAPIVWRDGSGDAGGSAGGRGRDRDNATGRGYVLEDKGWTTGKLALPNAWFSASELYALVMIDELARHIGPGLLDKHLAPLTERITMMLGAANDTPENVRSRVQILQSASARRMTPHFESVAAAAIRRKRVQIRYFTRSRNERTERVVSPQRLVHYRENWYVVAWCHRVDALRNFAIDSIEEATTLPLSAQDVPAIEVEQSIGRNFGMWSGARHEWARLLFTPLQARWVEAEVWHPEQRSAFQPDGGYLLEVPYSDPRELMLEILKYGPDVNVLGPAELRRSVAARLEAAAAQYRRAE